LANSAMFCDGHLVFFVAASGQVRRVASSPNSDELPHFAATLLICSGSVTSGVQRLGADPEPARERARVSIDALCGVIPLQAECRAFAQAEPPPRNAHLCSPRKVFAGASSA
jgi:hypothetical protein